MYLLIRARVNNIEGDMHMNSVVVSKKESGLDFCKVGDLFLVGNEVYILVPTLINTIKGDKSLIWALISLETGRYLEKKTERIEIKNDKNYQMKYDEIMKELNDMDDLVGAPQSFINNNDRRAELVRELGELNKSAKKVIFEESSVLLLSSLIYKEVMSELYELRPSEQQAAIEFGVIEHLGNNNTIIVESGLTSINVGRDQVYKYRGMETVPTISIHNRGEM